MTQVMECNPDLKRQIHKRHCEAAAVTFQQTRQRLQVAPPWDQRGSRSAHRGIAQEGSNHFLLSDGAERSAAATSSGTNSTASSCTVATNWAGWARSAWSRRVNAFASLRHSSPATNG